MLLNGNHVTYVIWQTVAYKMQFKTNKQWKSILVVVLLDGHMSKLYQEMSLGHFLALLFCDAHVPHPWSSIGDVHMWYKKYWIDINMLCLDVCKNKQCDITKQCMWKFTKQPHTFVNLSKRTSHLSKINKRTSHLNESQQKNIHLNESQQKNITPKWKSTKEPHT